MKRRTKMQITIGALLAIAMGVVKERMELMEGMGESMETLSDMFKGKTPYDAQAVETAAGRINELAGEKTIALFPAGSLHAPSEALPAIWDDWQRFEELASRLESYSDALVKAAENPRQMPDGMGASGNGGQGMMMGGNSAQGMMMGRGNAQRTMMGQGTMMESGQMLPDQEHLAAMPPQAVFMHLADTCSSCHTRFRLEKEPEQ